MTDPHEEGQGRLADLLGNSDAKARVRALAALLESATFSVVVFKTGPEITVDYLNRAASITAAVAPEAAVGLPVTQVFPTVDVSLLQKLLAGSRPGAPQAIKGLLATGSAYHVDSLRLDAQRVLVIGEEMGDEVSSRERLEALIESTDAIWRSSDLHTMAPLIVEQARRLLVDIDVGLCTQTADHPESLRVVAAHSDWLEVGLQIPTAGTFIGQAADTGLSVESTTAPEVSAMGPRLRGAGINTIRAVPITAGEPLPDGRRALGVLEFGKRAATPFTDAQRRLMDEFGKLVGLAAHRAELLADARESARRLELSLDVAIALASSASPRAIIELLLDRALVSVDADRATISRLEGQEFVVEATRLRSGELNWTGLRYPIESLERQPLVKRALETRSAVIGGQLNVTDAFEEVQQQLAKMRSTVTLPLLANHEPAGLLVVSRTTEAAFTATDVSTLQLMGNAAILALRTARLLEELRAANEVKSRFLNLAAHELRTPITLLRGYASMLSDGTIDAPNQMLAVKIIKDKSTELSRLTDELLLAVRIESGSLNVEVSDFDIVATVRAAVAELARDGVLIGSEVRLIGAENAMSARGDAQHVRTIIENLLRNAILYSDQAAEVQVRFAKNRDQIEVAIEDHGRGIPEAERDGLFQRFARVEDGGAMSTGGAGLGLYIARWLARAVGGELELIRSEPGQGSLFQLRLPSAPAPALNARPARSRKAAVITQV